MIKVNGARLDWLRYEFGIRETNGSSWNIGTLEQAEAAAAESGGKVIMRAIYATGWEETLHEAA